eukprot:TRINITY_DN61841_c0_g1_i1.p1 TRINITY_DN61841_c0_g1~~TRINITY_DN61841_c0_g1_i1.p1  ORF type:complete len:510 (+),score=129.98 TRINITY_DN61841_c0_g1_i1:80-1531(+)
MLAAALVAAAGAAAEWNCKGNRSLCNGCGDCCQSYFVNGSQGICDACIAQKCPFTCSGGECNVCGSCCRAYVPDGDTCADCTKQHCAGEPEVAPSPQPQDQSEWQCAADRARCNTCAGCCRDYVGPGAGCAACVKEQCSFRCSNGTCNVCGECCRSYIPNGDMCDMCVRQKCFEGETPAPSPPAPAGSDGWVCSAALARCNTCGECCRGYIPEGAACKDCATRQCQFSCAPAPADKGGGCGSVCEPCCRSYIPNGEKCDLCMRQRCFGHATPPAPSPTPKPMDGADGWLCGNWTSYGTCNTCPSCCKDWITHGPACKVCVTQECKFVCSGAQCNVCPECCQPYVPNGPQCDTCMRERCLNREPDPVPEEPLDPTASPSATAPPSNGTGEAPRAPETQPPGDSGGGAAIYIIIAAAVLVLAAGVGILQWRKHVIRRHRGAGPRRQKQMERLEELQMQELEKDAHAHDAGGVSPRAAYRRDRPAD